MQRAIPLRQALEAGPETVLALSDRGAVRRGDVVAGADALVQGLRESNSQCLMLRSADPAVILLTILVCWEERLDLIVAHLHLDEDVREQLAALLKPDTLLESTPGGFTVITLGKPVARARGTIILMTSGTTGLPKLAEHDPAALASRILASASVEANRGGRWLLTYQPTSFAGLQVLLTAALTAGTIVTATGPTPADFVRAAAHHGVTHISGTPTFWRSFLIAAAGVPIGSLRQVTVGGEAVDEATLARLARAYPEARITHIYASTEAGALFAVHDGKPGFPARWLETEIDGGTRLRIRDDELQVQSPRRMRRYVDRVTPATDDGWFPTGDLVRVCSDRVVFCGRRDAIINVGGMKVFPEDVESFLLGLPGIVESKVRAKANPISGQVLIAEIVVAAGADPEATRQSALQTCRTKLPRHQVPAVIRVVDFIAVNQSWKKA